MSDRRNAKTDEAIFDALQRLTEDKALDQITITDVSRAANITRKTFYDHFPSVSDAYQAFLDGVVMQLVAKTDKDWAFFLETENDWTPYLVVKTRLNLFFGNVREYVEPQIASSRMRNRHITLEEKIRYLRDPFKRAIRDGLLGCDLNESDDDGLVAEFILTGILWMYRQIILGVSSKEFHEAQEKICSFMMDGISGILQFATAVNDDKQHLSLADDLMDEYVDVFEALAK